MFKLRLRVSLKHITRCGHPRRELMSSELILKNCSDCSHSKANRKSIPQSRGCMLKCSVPKNAEAVSSNASLERSDLVGWYRESRSVMY